MILISSQAQETGKIGEKYVKEIIKNFTVKWGGGGEILQIKYTVITPPLIDFTQFVS